MDDPNVGAVAQNIMNAAAAHAAESGRVGQVRGEDLVVGVSVYLVALTQTLEKVMADAGLRIGGVTIYKPSGDAYGSQEVRERSGGPVEGPGEGDGVGHRDGVD